MDGRTNKNFKCSRKNDKNTKFGVTHTHIKIGVQSENWQTSKRQDMVEDFAARHR
jgi:hypothetical protein